MEDTYSQYSRVVQDYILYRPHYPPQLIDLLRTECALSPDHIVADVGSGTGLLTRLFLKNGNRVYGVEPNPDMRGAAESLMRSYSAFTSVNGTAEATTLADHSVHLIAVGQAFHWFNHELTRPEFLRILIPHGWVVLVWNIPLNNGTAFGNAYEQFWRTYVNANEQFRDPQRPSYVTRFFEGGSIREARLDNAQVCDFEALKGRILSASRAPQADDPRYRLMLDDLARLFNRYQQGGSVTLDYDTRIVYGTLS